MRAAVGETDSLWYKDAVFYELHVRAFADSNGDGIGDFQGLIGKLDYLRDLGITAIWLLPFFPSPLLDDGYDIANYTSVHPAYGTLDDFKTFLDEAHQRDLRVIIELVPNHTSDQHPWFQRARRAPEDSSDREFYVWSDSPEKYRDARIIFPDYEVSNWSWDAVAGAWYWHRFYAHQPDLNYEHPAVREAMFEVVDFWLELGVDGLRLDAVPYLAEQEGTTSENLPHTHRFLKQLRQRIDARYPDRMLLAEANQWPDDAATYFGEGDECQMAFHFPLMPRLFMALHTEDRLPVLDIMAQTPVIPESCQWALFLRNHDELTLEMVTDEERLFMYRAYAPADESRINLGIRHRLAPLLRNGRRQIELMNALLCSLPGTPVIYYGDEIGMGDNIYLGDRDGVRTPMQWGADRNAGFSGAPQQRLYLPLIVDYEYHHETVHVESQQRNSHSLLTYMKRLLALRKRYRAFGRGSIEFLQPTNQRVLAFVRRYEDESILVVANLARFSQAVELDLGAFGGCTPVELFGRTSFWPIDEEPYKLTLGPHAFYWFSLTPVPAIEPGDGQATATGEASVSMSEIPGAWTDFVPGQQWRELEEALPVFLGRQHWFRGKVESVLDVSILDTVPLRAGGRVIYLVPVTIAYSDRDADTYLLALQAMPLDADGLGGTVKAPISRFRSAVDGDAVLVEAIEEGTIDEALPSVLRIDAASLPGDLGEIVVLRNGEGTSIGEGEDHPVIVSHISDVANGDDMNDGRLVVKFLRRINEGINPEWELGVELTRSGFRHVPTTFGALEYRRPGRQPMVLAVLQKYIPNQGNAWDFTLGVVEEFAADARSQGLVVPDMSRLSAWDLLDAPDGVPPAAIADLIDPYLAFVRSLGRRAAELHMVLAGLEGQQDLMPEPFSSSAQRSRQQSMRGLTAHVLRGLRHGPTIMNSETRALANAVLDREGEVHDRFATILSRPLSGSRIRTHGDFHLRQVLRTGDDVVILDFEGEPDRFLEERRLKASPLSDVASMLHSFRMASIAAGERHVPARASRAEDPATQDALLLAWYRWVGVGFLAAYGNVADAGSFLPRTLDERALLLDALLLEKAILEVAACLHRAPDTIAQALRHVLELLGDG